MSLNSNLEESAALMESLRILDGTTTNASTDRLVRQVHEIWHRLIHSIDDFQPLGSASRLELEERIVAFIAKDVESVYPISPTRRRSEVSSRGEDEICVQAPVALRRGPLQFGAAAPDAAAAAAPTAPLERIRVVICGQENSDSTPSVGEPGSLVQFTSLVAGVEASAAAAAAAATGSPTDVADIDGIDMLAPSSASTAFIDETESKASKKRTSNGSASDRRRQKRAK